MRIVLLLGLLALIGCTQKTYQFAPPTQYGDGNAGPGDQ